MLTITSKDNINIKNVVKLKKSAKFRRECGLFVAEGVRICMDALYSESHIDTLFVTEKSIEKHTSEYEKLSEYADKTYIISPALFSLISDTKTPQGFLCTIKALDKTFQFDTIKNSDKFLALDNLQDPSNLGTILRTAEAFNISGVILSKDCCDIYSPKVVRGSMGAVFRIPFMICDSVCKFLNDNPQLNSFAAVVSTEANKVTQTVFDTPCVVVVGNEGNGIKAETIKACGKSITIPMDGRAESLNASIAASIIMWEMIR